MIKFKKHSLRLEDNFCSVCDKNIEEGDSVLDLAPSIARGVIDTNDQYSIFFHLNCWNAITDRYQIDKKSFNKPVSSLMVMC